MMSDQELKTIEPSGQAVTPMSMMQLAYEQKAPVETLERLFELKVKVDADEAKKAFNIAMAEFKKNPPKVLKDKINAQYNSRYAGIANLINTVSTELSKHGITHSFDQDSQSNPMSVTCLLTHENGHTESTTMYGNFDDSGKKNELQKIKSTMTYLRSATFESITGVIASDDGDDDGNTATPVLGLDEVTALFEGAKTLARLDSLARHASKLPDDEKEKARDVYHTRKEELSQ